MKPLNRNYKLLLAQIAQAVQQNLLIRIHDPRLKIQPITVNRTDTFGWETVILRLKHIPGSLQFWLCYFTNVGRPILCVCYSHGQFERVKKVAESFTQKIHEKSDLSQLDLKIWRNSNILAKPLPKKYFSKPLIESYDSNYSNFLTVFFPDTISLRIKPSRYFISKITVLTERLMRSMASALEAKLIKNKDFAIQENRKRVVQHITRERSSKLALSAKIRDGFTCRICNFNFADVYGELARGYAEAHHIVALSSLRKEIQTRVKDLITVCPNCHRVLHRMDGHPSDVARLRRIIQRTKKK